MKHLRFSVTSVLIAVTLLGLAFGALESDSLFVASLVFTLNLGLLCVAAVGALAARGNRRVFWLGFAVFGWVYSLIAFGWLASATRASPAYVWLGYGYQQDGYRSDRPSLVTNRLLDWYGSLRAPRAVGARVMADWRGAGYWQATIREVKNGRYRVGWDDGSPDEWVGPNQIQSSGRDVDRVGHSVFSPLIGMLGGILCWYLFADRRVQAETSGAVAA